MLQRLVRNALIASGPLLALMWILGRLLLDHRREWLAFFLIPAPFVIAVAALWLLVAGHKAPRMLRLAMGMALVAAVTHVAGFDMRWAATPRPPADALRITHWNVARLPLASGRIQEVLQADQPDICLLSETRTNPAMDSAGAALGLPHVFYSQSMTLLSRFPVEPRVTLALPEARGWCARLNTTQGPLDLLAVDVVSKPQLDRRPAVAALADWVRQHDPAIPLLVLGDFNTPTDSVAFRPLRTLLAHGYESAGRGWPYSWPLPAPVYAIDHAWYTRDTITMVDYRLKSAAISDHRRQVLHAVLHPGKTGA